nr:phosphoribosylamine--glycine ligase [Govania unica]
MLIGSGGREHALAWSLAASPLVGKLYCAPGNGGIVQSADCVTLDPLDLDAVVRFCRDKNIGLVVVGPEAPLVAGLVDRLTSEGIKAFGPTAAAAALEGSKGFTKDLCARNGIPTAAYARLRDADAAKAYLRTQALPIVIKADGLAAGKGVIIAESLSEADAAIDDMFGGEFGAAGAEVVIEEFMTGEEASFFVLTDGEHILPMATAQDHKRVGDGDTGPNTGGMGAYSPASIMTDELTALAIDSIIKPTVRGMQALGIPYKGVLYAGLMLTPEGPKLVEYNARFGDPECQVLMTRLKSDLVTALLAVVDGNLDQVSLQWRDEVALTVVMAAKGYPGAYDKGTEIRGLDAAGAVEGVQVFHAGTQAKDGKILASGGRVLNVTAVGKTVTEARDRAYQAVDLIDWPEGFSRRDIGWREIERETKTD